MKNKYKFLLFLIISSSINSDDLMKPTSFSKDLYKQDILAKLLKMREIQGLLLILQMPFLCMNSNLILNPYLNLQYL